LQIDIYLPFILIGVDEAKPVILMLMVIAVGSRMFLEKQNLDLAQILPKFASIQILTKFRLNPIKFAQI